MFGKQKTQLNSARTNTGRAVFAVVLLFATVIVTSLFASNVPTADAAIPKLINFQGKLTAVSNGSNVANGTYTFEFKLYDDPTAGSLLWTETWDGSPSPACDELQVTNGVFNAKLGACNSLAGIDFTGGNLYLSVNFDPGSGFDGEMSPRKQLASSAYAFVANGVSGDGRVNVTPGQSATALTVARSGTDYAFQVDTNTASSATGLKVTSAAAAGGLALNVISSGTNENLTLDAKGSGTISIGATSTGDILLGGGSGSTGCTVTNSSGAFACTSTISSGVAGGTIGGYNLSGNTSGTISILPQAAAGTFNFNLPTTAGSSGHVLTSGGGGASPMTWTNPSTFATTSLRLDQITAATTSAGIDSSNNPITWNWSAMNTSVGLTLASSGTLLSSGGVLRVSSASTSAISSGILQVASTGNYTGTAGTLNVSASLTQAGTVASFSGVSLTTGHLLTLTPSTSMTTGAALNIPSGTYNPGVGATGNLVNLAFTNNSNTTSGTSVVSGINIAPTISAAGSGGTHETYGIRIQAAAGTPVAGTQDIYGIRIGNQGRSGAETSYGLYLDAQSGSTNNYALITNGGNVGIGDTSPASLFTVGSGDLFQINSTGQIGSQQAPVSDYLFALAGTTGNDNSRIIDITQANDAGENSSAINVVNTVNPGTVTGAREVNNVSTSLTPTTTLQGGSLILNGSKNAVSIANLIVGNNGGNEATGDFYGGQSTLDGTFTVNDNTGDGNGNYIIGFGQNNRVAISPSITNLSDLLSMTVYGSFNSTAGSGPSHANATYRAYGTYIDTESSLSTGADSIKYGIYNVTRNAADINYGIYSTVSGATTNYSGIFTGGNFGIDDTTPASLFTVGSGDLFQVNSSGDITTAAGESLNITTGTTGAISLDSGGGGIVNLANGNTSKTITLGIGTGGNTINIATNNSISDTVNIGSALDNVAITGDQWSITNAGVLTVASCTGCGGALTPWTSDIDADGYDLRDLSNLEFQGTTGAPLGSVVAVFSDNTGDLNANVLTAKTFNVQVNGSDEYNFSSSALALNSNDITGGGTITGVTINGTSAIQFNGTDINTAGTLTNVAYENQANAFTAAQGITIQSATALTVARSGTDYAFQVDTNTASSATGLKVTAAAAGGGAAIAAISSGTNEFLTIDAKGTGQVRIGGVSTGDVLLAGGAGTTGCTVGNSSGSFTCDAQGVFGNYLSVGNGSATSLSGVLRVNTSSSTDFVVGAKNTYTHSATGSLFGAYGLQNLTSSSAVVVGGGVGQNIYGIHNSVTKTGADTATGTYNLYADYNVASNTGRTNAGTVNTYGGYFLAEGDTAGTSTTYALYANAFGADTNYAIYSAAGLNNFVGDTTVGNITITGTCTGCGGGGAWDALTAPSGNLSLAHAANTTTMTFNSLTTGTAWTQSSTSITSGSLYSFGQSSSTFTGNGILMNMANGSGSFTGNFADFQVNGTSRFKVNSGTVTTSGASAVAGTLQDMVMNNSTGSGFQYGNRAIATISSGTAGTHVGQFIRMIDNTSLNSGQNVRGLEVQSYSGTNVNGTNTGIASFAYTFGIQATTTAQAASQATPAAVFADLDNGSNATVGNAIRAYTDNATSADLVYLYQETSAYTGNALLMDLGNGSGSFASGNFINLKNAGTSKLTYSSAGRMDLFATDAANITPLYINTEESTAGQVVFGIESDTTNGSGVDTLKFKITADGSTYNDPGTFTTPADIAEMYNVVGNLESGDVVEITEVSGYADGNNYGVKKHEPGSAVVAMGVVSTKPGQTLGYEWKRPEVLAQQKAIALAGRVPVKVTNENGVIEAGDFLTASASVPGYAMKAIKAGTVIGQALESFSGGVGKIEAFVKATDYSGVSIESQIAGLEFDYSDSELSQETSVEILEYLLTQLPNLDTDNLSQVSTDVVIAAGEIVTPTVTTQTLRADFLTSATSEGGLEVASTTMFGGGLTVDNIGAIGDLLSFSSDVEFFGTPYFTSDTAGFAVVKAGVQTVDVSFTNEYLAQPIVNASISFEQDVDQTLLDDEAREVLRNDAIAAAQSFLSSPVSYVITNKSKFGFTIVLNQPASTDIKFSWTALAVRNATTFMSLDAPEAPQDFSGNDGSGDIAGDFTPPSGDGSGDESGSEGGSEDGGTPPGDDSGTPPPTEP